MAITTEDFYRSSNGDRWQLIRDTASGRSFVRHEPNLLSGGRATDTDVRSFRRCYPLFGSGSAGLGYVEGVTSCR